MSSFLDSTGLSRLASKITDYFAKKNGTYPSMTVGKATSADKLKIEEIGASSINLDTLTASDGQVHYYFWSNNNRGNVTNKPSDAVYTVQVLPAGAGNLGTYVIQIAYRRGTTDIYVRRRSDGSTSWSAWTNIHDASWINSGTFGTDRIADDAITAAKVKDNETLPVNVSGSAGLAQTLPRGYVKFSGSLTGYKHLATIDTPSTTHEVSASFDLYETIAGATFQNYRGVLSVKIRNDGGTYSYGAVYTGKPLSAVSLSVRQSANTHCILIYISKQGGSYCGLYAILCGAGGWGANSENYKVNLNQDPDVEDVSGYPEISLTQNLSVTASPNGVGSPTRPVYAKSDGSLEACSTYISMGTAVADSNVLCVF